MHLAEPCLMSAFVLVWEGREEGPADLLAISTGDHDTSDPDHTPYVTSVGEKHESGPS